MFKCVDEVQAWREVDNARQRLSMYVCSISEGQWNQPSLCEGWRVRDVVAHLILEYRYNPLGGVIGLARSGFHTNAFLRDSAVKLGTAPPAELLRRFDAISGDKRKAGSVCNVLVDLLVHEQDIRIHFGNQCDMPKPASQLI